MALMIFLPVALIVLACLAAMAMIVKGDSRSRSLCERHAMILQNDLTQHLESLLQLNPRARSLRRKLNRLKTQYAAAISAGQEAIAIALQNQIRNVSAEQLALNAEQRAIIMAANSHIESDADQWRYALRGMSPLIAQRNLQVVATPRGQIAPEYEPVANFSNKQAIRAQYQMTMAQLLDGTTSGHLNGNIISSLLAVTGNPISGIVKESCAATVAQRGSHFYARLWWAHQ